MELLNSKIYFKLPTDVLRMFYIFKDYEIYIVGGCVRDLIMEIEPHDYDFTTNATPEQMKVIAKKNKIDIIPTGEKYGTMTFKLDNNLFEVTTFRGEKNSSYSDGRRPDNVEFGVSLLEDLNRRDFTMNAIAYAPKKGIVDPFNGLEDIQNKIIRTVGEADKRFQEDALRMLRAFRFAGRFNFRLDHEIEKAVERNKELIDNVSKERIGSELIQILSSDRDLVYFEPLLKYIFKLDRYIFYVGTVSLLSKLYMLTEKLSEEELNKYAFGKTIVQGILNLRKVEEICNNFESNFYKEPKQVFEILKTKEERLSFFETPHNFLVNTKTISELIKAILFNEPIFVSDLDITGNDIKTIFKVEGKEVGRLLKIAQRYVWRYPNKNNKDLIVKYIKENINENI